MPLIIGYLMRPCVIRIIEVIVTQKRRIEELGLVFGEDVIARNSEDRIPRYDITVSYADHTLC